MPVPSAFGSFADQYIAGFTAAIHSLDRDALERMATILATARTEGRCVFVAGNGGSAAVANHMECDATKGTHVEGKPPLRSRSLSSNTSIMTALANDLGYEFIFEKQVEYYANPGDVLILVSSGGNSPNVVRACRYARAHGITSIALVGFGGGELKQLADCVVHVPVDNYGIVEDAHQAVFHLIFQILGQAWRA